MKTWNIGKMASKVPKDYGVRGSEAALSSSIEKLNSHPNAGLMSYNMYVRQNRLGLWSTRKGIYFDYYEGLCQVCKLRKATTLHHSPDAYSRLGKEEIAGDLTPICQKCHWRIHQPEIEQKSYGSRSDGISAATPAPTAPTALAPTALAPTALAPTASTSTSTSSSSIASSSTASSNTSSSSVASVVQTSSLASSTPLIPPTPLTPTPLTPLQQNIWNIMQNQ